MGGLIMAAQLIAGLSLLVLVHEFGHFAAARMFGMRCDKFFIFFDAWGKKLWSKKIGDTEYGIGWLPLGGYVKIAGMIDETMDKEAMKEEPQPWEFRSKPAWQRFIVMIGGIVMNLITGVIIFSAYIMVYEKDYIPAESVNQIYAFETADSLGFKTGDKIIAVNGKMPKRFKDVVGYEMMFGADVEVDRNGERKIISLPDDLFNTLKGQRFLESINHSVSVWGVMENTGAANAGLLENDKFLKINGLDVTNFGVLSDELKANKSKDVKLEIERAGEVKQLTALVGEDGKLGFGPKFDRKASNPVKEYSFYDSVVYGSKEGWDAIYYNAVGMGKMFTGKINPVESLQSPIGIARKIYGPVWHWDRFWKITGLLSFILAFMNILPIPALDGGHMLFLSYEMITRRKLSDEFLERAQMVGMLILIPLMLFILGKDLLEIVKDFFM